MNFWQVLGVFCVVLLTARIIRARAAKRRRSRLADRFKQEIEDLQDIVRQSTLGEIKVTVCMAEEIAPETKHALQELAQCAIAAGGFTPIAHECQPETVIDPIEVPPSIFSTDHVRRFVPGPKYVRCRVCQRPLANHESQAAGFGPVCGKRVREMELTPRDT